MYKLIKDSEGVITGVFNSSNNLSIPFDPANTDYQAYLKWLEEGNTPSPAESATPLPADE